MQKVDGEKTKSARKTYVRYGLAALAVVVLILPFFFVGRPTVTLESGGRSYRLEIVSTAESREKGLGGRQNMASDRGMIFVFDPPGVQCIWMKDMQFSLDVIWLNSAKKVTKVAANVSPASYPEKYCGDDTTKYVIELNAGETAKANIAVGHTLQL